MSDPAEKKRDVPEPVQAALSVLAEFEKTGPSRSRALKKKLPALAVRMAEAGEEVTEEKLREIAKGGIEVIDALQSRFMSAKEPPPVRSYDSVIEKLGVEPVEDPPPGFDETRFDTPMIALAFAAEAGRGDIVAKLLAEDPELVHDEFVSYGLNQATLKGDLEMVRLLAEAGANLHYADDAIMKTALLGGNLELVDYLQDKGFDFAAEKDRLLPEIASHPNSEAGVACLLKHEPSQKAMDEALAQAAKFHKPAAADLLIQEGANTAAVDPEDQRAILPRIERYRLWLQVQHRKPPQSLADYNPYLFKPNIYADVVEMMKREGHDTHAGRLAAANAATLFGSTDRVLRYLERWGEADSTSPLFDLCQSIAVPQKKRIDLKSWGDAVLKHGPGMGRLVRYGDRIEKPGSLVETGQKAAKLAYRRAEEELELAGHCLTNGVDENGFNAALDMKKEVVDKIPEDGMAPETDKPDPEPPRQRRKKKSPKPGGGP